MLLIAKNGEILSGDEEVVEVETEGQNEEYKNNLVSPLYSDGRGMLLQPKKKKEYRYSRDLNVITENMSPMSSRVGGSTRSF